MTMMGMTTSTKRLIVVVGATGSGKTSLSIELARHFSAPIISTDSRQFYRGIPIGTAQPTPVELSMAEHHFIACRDLSEDFNAGAYEAEALERLDSLFQKHDVVIAVGGSGLYIKALCEGLDALPDCDVELRATIRQRFESEGLEPLLDELKILDPNYWESVDRCNPARVMRGLELCITSGVPCSTLRTGESKQRNFQIIKVGIDMDRAELYDRINRRVDIMVEDGLEAEVKSVYPLRALNSLQSVGYRELFDYMDGVTSRSEAIELIKRNSRRYAKRQMTWFRRDPNIKWFSSPDSTVVIEYIG